MLQRHLGSTGLKVSRIGLGTITWATDTDEHEAEAQLRAFVDAGGTLLDTAGGYGGGASEELIGTLLSRVVDRNDIVLATKAGITRRSGERNVDISRGALLRDLDTSLARLGVDHVDLWQVHTWSAGRADRRDVVRSRRGRHVRAGALRRRLQLLRLADRAGSHPPAVGAGPGQARPRRRSSTRCSSAASSARSSRLRRRWVSASSRGRRWAAGC